MQVAVQDKIGESEEPDRVKNEIGISVGCWTLQ